TVKIVGDQFAQTVVQNWITGFRSYHPGAQISAKLEGTLTAMAGIYTSTADIALMGRPATVSEHDAFYFVFRHEPLSIEVMNGSLDVSGKSSALVIFVNRDNPLQNLTLAQLDAVFGMEHKRGLKNIRTWGELGVSGEWANHTVNVYMYDSQTGPGAYFDQVVLKGSSKWSWDHIREFKDIARAPNGFEYPAGKQIVDALSADRYGLAVSSLRYVRPDVKAVALAGDADQGYYAPTPQNIVQRLYPLSRSIVAYVNCPSGQPLDPRVSEFLRYVLSREGQEAVRKDSGYLPLSIDTLTAQLNVLSGEHR
ncbi:MAG: substrate-binding domain-containing protein, partial [Acidobacteriaceae bacterium]|nr:substrate-binding domain-containing protein [Acidobacteriaceae bacterium]